MSPEFELIAKYFTRPVKRAALGVGDDCALIDVAPDSQLAISTDTLVAGTHFFHDADPQKLGHKALAVNLSDLAAMGARPCYVTLALTLPTVDASWLAAFSRGFFALADEFDVDLIGGDTTRGPLSITITAFGEVGVGLALRRDGAKDGDDIWISGSLGDAALALKHMLGTVTLASAMFDIVAQRLHQPNPRISLGRALTGVASSAIDISDGLVADLTHICECSALSALLSWPAVPLSKSLLSVALEHRYACALTGGDDYELCFTAPETMRHRLVSISTSSGVALSRVGSMRRGSPKVTVCDEHGRELPVVAAGFDHFANKI